MQQPQPDIYEVDSAILARALAEPRSLRSQRSRYPPRRGADAPEAGAPLTDVFDDVLTPEEAVEAMCALAAAPRVEWANAPNHPERQPDEALVGKFRAEACLDGEWLVAVACCGHMLAVTRGGR